MCTPLVLRLCHRHCLPCQSNDSVFSGEISSLHVNPALSPPPPHSLPPSPAPVPPATPESRFASSRQTLPDSLPRKTPARPSGFNSGLPPPVRPAPHEPVERAVFFACSALQDGQVNVPRPGRDRAFPAGVPSTGPPPQGHKPPSFRVSLVPGTGGQLSRVGARRRCSRSSRSICGAAGFHSRRRVNVTCVRRERWLARRCLVMPGREAPGRHVARSGRGWANVGGNTRFLITASEREDVP